MQQNIIWETRRIFGIRFKITSSTTPDDRSIGYLHQPAPTNLTALPCLCLSWLTPQRVWINSWLFDSYHSPSSRQHSPHPCPAVHLTAINSTLREQNKNKKKREKKKRNAFQEGLAYKRKICFDDPNRLSVTMTTMSAHCGKITEWSLRWGIPEPVRNDPW